MKCMILVPEDAYARFEQKQKLETSPIMKNIINTDTAHNRYFSTHRC